MPNPAPKKVRERKVKAFVVCDSSYEPLNLKAFKDHAQSGMIMVFADKETPEKTWRGWPTVPCTISFSVPKIIRTKKK